MSIFIIICLDQCLMPALMLLLLVITISAEKVVTGKVIFYIWEIKPASLPRAVPHIFVVIIMRNLTLSWFIMEITMIPLCQLLQVLFRDRTTDSRICLDYIDLTLETATVSCLCCGTLCFSTPWSESILTRTMQTRSD